MTTTSVVKEVVIEKDKTKSLKVFQFGVKTADLVSDFGDDSSPLKDMIAIYSDTSETGESVIIGYLNKNQISNPGEKRIFSLKEDGSLSTSIHLKNDETLEIAGSINNAVTYSPLNIALQKQVLALNAELVKIAGVLNTLAPASYIATPVSIDISGAKVDNVKLP